MQRIYGMILTKKLSFENNTERIALFGDSGKNLEAFLVLFAYSCRECSLPAAEFSSFSEAAVDRGKVLHWLNNYN